MKADKCVKCGVSFEGESMFETFKSKRGNGDYFWKDKTDEEIDTEVKKCYSPPYKWNKKIGIEILGKYDGVSYYKCFSCGYTWDRFTGEGWKN